MTSPLAAASAAPAPALWLCLAASLVCLGLACAPTQGLILPRWRQGLARPAIRALTRALAFAGLAGAAACADEGWLIPLVIALMGAAEGMAALGGGVAPAALAPLLLAEAAAAALFARTGGGVGLVRAEPIRVAPVLALASGGVLAVRIWARRLGPAQTPVLVTLMAGAAAAATGFALPLSRWAAMAGGVGVFAALCLDPGASMGAPASPGRVGRLLLTYVALAAIAVSFTPFL